MFLCYQNRLFPNPAQLNFFFSGPIPFRNPIYEVFSVDPLDIVEVWTYSKEAFNLSLFCP